MSFRPAQTGYRRRGPPGWLVVLVGILIVFGGYYLWTGFLAFMEGQGDLAAPLTQAAAVTQTEFHRPTPLDVGALRATWTPVRQCQAFEVRVDRAVVRECPSTDCKRLAGLVEGQEVCVYGRATQNPEWYEVDLNPDSIFSELGYMHQSVIAAKFPTPTASATPRPLPTVTDTPTFTPPPTFTLDPRTPPTPLPTITPTPTAIMVTA